MPRPAPAEESPTITVDADPDAVRSMHIKTSVLTTLTAAGVVGWMTWEGGSEGFDPYLFAMFAAPMLVALALPLGLAYLSVQRGMVLDLSDREASMHVRGWPARRRNRVRSSGAPLEVRVQGGAWVVMDPKSGAALSVWQSMFPDLGERARAETRCKVVDGG